MDDNCRYLPPVLRQIIQFVRLRSSLVDLACDEAALYGEGISSQAEIVLQSLQSLEEMVSRVLSFRFPHKKLADDNFQVRPAGAKGSGGYTTNVLTMLLRLSMDARARIAAARPAMRERHRL